MSDPHEYDHRGLGDASDAESELDLARRMHEQQHRPASIDMALNLERELDDEHDEYDQEHGEVSANSASTTREGDGNGNEDSEGAAAANRRVSLDPQVLQHIVANLREDLSRAAQERDALAETLAGAPTREAELREALSLLTERCAVLEAELEQLRRKSQDDDDAIHMLRTKLEESRRALMRLQTESKRVSQMSHMSIDTSRANSFFSTAPSSSKRASFTPLTGSGAARIQNHRRISSVSEPSFVLDTGAEPPSPTGASRTISWPEEGDVAAANSNAKKTRRSSAFFGGAPVSMAMARSTSPSPPNFPHQLMADTSLNANMTAQELEALRKERDAARAELAAARQELAEAQDAREASEQCVAALRTFISAQTTSDTSSSGGNGTTGILKLPPLPTEKNAELGFGEQTPSKKTRPGVGAGWSFGKLFRADSASPASSATDSNSVSPRNESVPAASPAVSGAATPGITTTATTTTANTANTPSPSTATPGGAFSRTFGGFFSGRAPSITSIASVSPSSAKPARPPTAHGQQEPTMNGLGSDEEGGSVDEPPEPASPDIGPREGSEIWVRNASSAGSDVAAGDAASLSSKNDAAAELVGEHEREEAPVQVGAA